MPTNLVALPLWILKQKGIRSDKTAQGTYVVKELVYAYVMWISAKFHQQYHANSSDGGKYAQLATFNRLVRSIETYKNYVSRGDIIELEWNSFKNQPYTNSAPVKLLFDATQFKPIMLINATAQVALTHHLDDEVSSDPAGEPVMLNLIPFDFNSNSVRVIMLDDGSFLFVARDVAIALGYADTVGAVTKHCKKAKSLKDIDLPNWLVKQNQELTLDPKTKLIPESDVYRLVLRSKLESAEAFQDWVVAALVLTH